MDKCLNFIESIMQFLVKQLFFLKFHVTQGNLSSSSSWLLLSIARMGQQRRRSASGSGQVGVGDHGVTELSDECRRVTTIVTTSPPLTNGIVPRCQQSVDTPTMHNYGITPECPQCLVSSASGVQSQTRVQSRVQSSVHCQV